MKHKRIKGLALFALLVAVTTVYFYACKKDRIIPINNMTCQTDLGHDYGEEARKIVGKVKKFKRQLVDKEYVTRSNLYMPVDSVIWNIEALFNAEYTFPERKYKETVKQELLFYIELNADNEASFADVADLYDEITESVRNAYSDDGINYDKSLMAVVVDKGEIVGNRLEIKVLVVSGKMDADTTIKDPVPGPFGPKDCWYYGEYGGTCEDPSVFYDAAEIIEDTINYYYSNKPLPRAGIKVYNHSMFRISLEGNEYLDRNGDPYLYFYDVNDNPPVYLDYELLNYYYNRELEVIMHQIPDDPLFTDLMPLTPAFINVDIQGILGMVSNGSYMHHKNYVIYGTSMLIPDTVFIARDLLE